MSKEITSLTGATIKLSHTAIKHIIQRHPEVKPYLDQVIETIEKPDLLIQGGLGEIKALKFYDTSRGFQVHGCSIQGEG